MIELREGIRLQNRDVELLIFLGRYKIISLDNTRYIYGTVTYQEKRIVNLVKHNYIRRLRHRYITLGTKGKKYLLENGFEVREHFRNENNIERLNVISDIASCLIHDNMNFIPSWNMKKEDEPTTHSRRYIGKLEYNNQDEFLVYAIYEGKDDKYIKSIYYDIRKEHEYKKVMIFANDIEKIVLHEKGFFFGNDYTVLVPYNEYGKFLIRNNYEIRNSIYLRLKELYKVELTDFKFADLKLDDDNYIVIMPLINMEKLVRLHYYFKENRDCKNIHIFGLEEYKKIIEKYIPECSYKSLTREKINELLEHYEDTGGEGDGTI